MTFINRPKPRQPSAPIRPERRTVPTCKEILPGTRDEILEQLQKLPKDMTIRASINIDYGYDYNPSSYMTATYSRLETDEEYALQLNYYEKRMVSYHKAVAKYMKRLNAWDIWHEANKSEIQSRKALAKDLETRKLKVILAKTQKKLKNLEAD